MKLLLDTHIWLWLVGNPSQLGPNTLGRLQDPNNELWLSPINTWEAFTLHRKRRMFLGPDLRIWLAKASSGTHEAHLTSDIVLAAMQLSLHEDPADRFLAATAQVLDLVLVTADERLLGLGNVKTLANR